VGRRGSPALHPVAAIIRPIQVLAGRDPKPRETERFSLYLRLLVEWNRAHRLTAARSAEAMVADLFVDSLLFLSNLPSGPIRMADLGTGPGIPGVPLRIVRDDIALTLVESKRKRVSFLATLKRELELTDVVVLEGRAEELVEERTGLAGAFDVVVVRAVGSWMLPIAMSYLRPGGLFLAGGPPPGGSRDALGGVDSLGMRRQTKTFDQLGLNRAFLVSQKPS
jgi:16S rRNA (guanine527-N7)-methyltransferase